MLTRHLVYRAMSQDDVVYPFPGEFDPQRFLDSTVPDDVADRMNPENYVFGFGRRYVPRPHYFRPSRRSILYHLLVPPKAIADVIDVRL